MSADLLKIKISGKLRNNLNDKNIRRLNRIAGILYMVFGLALIIGVVYTRNKY